MGRVVKLCNYVSIETLRGKKVFFPAKWSFSKEAGVEGKFFGNCRKIFNRAAKTAFRLPVGNFFKKNTVCEKESFSSQFRKSIENVSAFVDFFYGGVVKITFYVSIGTFWGIYFFQFAFFFFISGQWVKNFLHFLKKNSIELSKLHSKCQWWNIGVNLFNRSIVFLILFGNWAKSLGLLTKILWRNFENYILRDHQDNLGLFSKKNKFPSFLDCER